ncbi:MULTISPECIES: PDDEXK nuclease domain-containing protein [Chryseobacterium]|uniref:Nuclease of restriction endonuclease-like (RecB) superfamily n=1 Tax=Chryseobacterium camelliae TaxID=1265445 RepID=A0ABU0TD87_9FLAO|nr:MULTISPECIES: PDDEXK nuclease domain-containing protein [Chryseobacterium]MDT3407174.1 putative nuclease of restriction endonuclease-like (RecB) superfamily [Pseudacidovorax intermedius]MDQ1095036.1 putative nuclease of restriction endonuclease-like (RecB) superfamily [Chryseobacterium camelliae]MDQ1098975.1 putative nuclease of restriction endonuclease-like (RecB) superfamily [Chryseobacterium sp. SORGH_AS_1048]MDR6086323.1 putative nuclease of restriction endonuclease-like (RecB) superfami
MEVSESSLFHSIKDLIQQSREKVFRIANSTLLLTYWQIGKLIVEDQQKGKERAEYGSYTLKNLSRQLTTEFGKGFDYTNLSNMRKFYQAFPIVDTLSQQLSWSHYRLLSSQSDKTKRDYYLKEAIENNWNVRNLKRQINSLAYERILEHRKTSEETIQNVLKDPYVFEFLGLKPDEKISEKDLETAIIDHIQKFLLEFGRGFAFVARQQHIATDTSDFYIDLVFYNYILKCFVLIDLKTGELSHQDIGQIDMYVRMYDDLKRVEGDNPTLGILLCSEKDETIVKYSVLNDKNNLFASKYLLYLPKEEELKQIIDQDRIRFELDRDQSEN